ncbi:MAG: hypothetical protein MHM6MM_001824 [Cercozoa sp. M6MM]
MLAKRAVKLARGASRRHGPVSGIETPNPSIPNYKINTEEFDQALLNGEVYSAKEYNAIVNVDDYEEFDKHNQWVRPTVPAGLASVEKICELLDVDLMPLEGEKAELLAKTAAEEALESFQHQLMFLDDVVEIEKKLWIKKVREFPGRVAAQTHQRDRLVPALEYLRLGYVDAAEQIIFGGRYAESYRFSSRQVRLVNEAVEEELQRFNWTRDSVAPWEREEVLHVLMRNPHARPAMLDGVFPAKAQDAHTQHYELDRTWITPAVAAGVLMATGYTLDVLAESYWFF